MTVARTSTSLRYFDTAQVGVPDDRQNGAGDDVPVVVDVDRYDRLDVEDLLVPGCGPTPKLVLLWNGKL